VTTVRNLFEDFEAEGPVKRGRARSQERPPPAKRINGANFVSWTRVRGTPSDTQSDPGVWDLEDELERAEACVQDAREGSETPRLGSVRSASDVASSRPESRPVRKARDDFELFRHSL
jgi:hypothetical protein